MLARTYVYRSWIPGSVGKTRTIRGSADPGTDSGAELRDGKTAHGLWYGTYGGRSGIDCLSVTGDGEKVGKRNFEEYYEKVRRAVRETEGLVAEYDGELIEPFYCLASAGKTRELRCIRIFLLWRVGGIWKRMDFYMSGRSRKASLRTGSADRRTQPAADGIAEKIRSSSGTAPDM